MTFMTEIITGEALAALLRVVMIDFMLAGDNAIVIGFAAAGLGREQRKCAVIVGIVVATVLHVSSHGAYERTLRRGTPDRSSALPQWK